MGNDSKACREENSLKRTVGGVTRIGYLPKKHINYVIICLLVFPNRQKQTNKQKQFMMCAEVMGRRSGREQLMALQEVWQAKAGSSSQISLKVPLVNRVQVGTDSLKQRGVTWWCHSAQHLCCDIVFSLSCWSFPSQRACKLVPDQS